MKYIFDIHYTVPSCKWEDSIILVANIPATVTPSVQLLQPALGLIWESGRFRRQEIPPRRTWRDSSITILGFRALTLALYPIMVSDTH